MAKKSALSDVDSVVGDIKSMRVRGALNIAVTAAKSMKEVVISGGSLETLQDAGRRLKGARPTAVSLPNSVDYVIYLAEKNSRLEDDESRKQLIEDIDGFIHEMENSLYEIAKIGSNMIRDGEVLLTHCNSDTVIEILKRAWSRGKRFSVYATETRPRMQGHITSQELIDAKIPVTLIVDSAACLTMETKKVDKVLVGADTVCVDGDVVNKIGTSQVALCAKKHSIDFIVAVESIKFSPHSMMGSVVQIEERNPDEVWLDRPSVLEIYNPAFDITDASMVDMIVTELGIMPPEAVYQVVKEKFSWELRE